MEKKYCYCVTARKPSVTTQSLIGKFVSREIENLIVCKNNYVNVYDGKNLESVTSFQIYGRIIDAKFFLPRNHPLGNLIILTEHLDFFILSYDENQGKIITLCKSHFQKSRYRVNDLIQKMDVSPSCNLIEFSLFEGLVKVIPIKYNTGERLSSMDFGPTSNVRMSERKIRDSVFVRGIAGEDIKENILCVLYDDVCPKLKVYEIDETKDISLRKKELEKHKEDNLTKLSPLFLVPVGDRIGGLIIVGNLGIIYKTFHKNGTSSKMMFKERTYLTCYTKIDSSRYLFGDSFGKIFLFCIERDSTVEKGFNLIWKKLGETTIIDTLSYIGNGVVYVGSRHGDSVMLKLSDKENEENNCYFKEIGEEKPNIGPILDLTFLYDGAKQHKNILVTCSGIHDCGTLRILRKGVGVEEISEINFPQCPERVFTLKDKLESISHKYIVVSFPNTTVFSEYDNETQNVKQIKMNHFLQSTETILCANLKNGIIIQVTPKEIVLFNPDDEFFHKEKKTGDHKIANAKLRIEGEKQILVLSMSNKTVLFYEIKDNGDIKKVCEKCFESEISSLDIISKRNIISVVIGFWNKSISFFSIPDFRVLLKTIDNLPSIPRELTFFVSSKKEFLVVSLGNGELISYEVDMLNATFNENIHTTCGIKSSIICPLRIQNKNCVFICGQRPSSLYEEHDRLLYALVNYELKEGEEVLSCAQFDVDSEADANQIVTITNKGMMICEINNLDGFQIDAVDLDEQPKLLEYFEKEDWIVVGTQKQKYKKKIVSEGKIRVFSSINYEEITDFRQNLKIDEHVSAMKYLVIKEVPVVFVGTTFVYSHEIEPKNGRILMYGAIDNKFKLLGEKSVNGSVVSIELFRQNYILVGVNSRVFLYEISGSDTVMDIEEEDDDDDDDDLMGRFKPKSLFSGEIKEITNYSSHLFVNSIATIGDNIFISDALKSISLIQFSGGSLKKVCTNYEPIDLTSTSIIDNETIICSDYHGNFMIAKVKGYENEEDQGEKNLEVLTKFHIGDSVNIIKKGKLVAHNSRFPSFVFGTVSGRIGVIGIIPQNIFLVLRDYEMAIQKEIIGVGELENGEYRRFKTDFQTEESINCIDGDLLESFPKLTEERKKNVLTSLNRINPDKYYNVTISNMEKLIDNFSRNFH